MTRHVCAAFQRYVLKFQWLIVRFATRSPPRRRRMPIPWRTVQHANSMNIHAVLWCKNFQIFINTCFHSKNAKKKNFGEIFTSQNSTKTSQNSMMYSCCWRAVHFAKVCFIFKKGRLEFQFLLIYNFQKLIIKLCNLFRSWSF